MSKTFFSDEGNLYLQYEAFQGVQAVFDILDGRTIQFGVDKGTYRIQRTFYFRRQDVSNYESDIVEEITFLLGEETEGCWKIEGRKLGIDVDVYLTTDMKVSNRIFQASRSPIFKALGRVAEGDIWIADGREGAIPLTVFDEMLTRFPTQTTMEYWADQRVASIIDEFVETRKDFSDELDKHLERQQARTGKSLTSRLGPESVSPVLQDLELTTFRMVRKELERELMRAEAVHESEWRKRIAPLLRIVYPRYVAVLEEVEIPDGLSGKKRFIDLLMVDSDGTVDVLELKVPSVPLLLKTRYRDNYVPQSQLNATVVQSEKYIFHLIRGGKEVESAIEKRLFAEYPELEHSGLKIRVTNPQAIVMAGRSDSMDEVQRRDFEFYKRGLKSVVEVMSYDDLLSRIDNIIASLDRMAEPSESRSQEPT